MTDLIAISAITYYLAQRWPLPWAGVFFFQFFVFFMVYGVDYLLNLI